MTDTITRKPQVLTIDRTGAIEGVDFKEKGFNVKGMGKAQMTRATDIEWDDDKGGYMVKFLAGIMKGMHMNTLMLDKANGKDCPVRTRSVYPLCVFSTYEEAVDAEVKVLQWALASGKKKLFVD